MNYSKKKWTQFNVPVKYTSILIFKIVFSEWKFKCQIYYLKKKNLKIIYKTKHYRSIKVHVVKTCQIEWDIGSS